MFILSQNKEKLYNLSGHIEGIGYEETKEYTKDNCNIENLFLIDNETNLEMNRRELRFDEAELTKVGRNIAKLNISARNRKKGKR